MPYAVASPRPTFRSRGLVVKKGSKIRACTSGVIPHPVSRTTSVTWRVAAWAPAPVVELPPLPAGTETPEPIASRPVRFERGADVTPTPVFARNDLGAGARIAGPALIQERETTVVLRPGWDAEVATDGSVVATRRAS